MAPPNQPAWRRVAKQIRKVFHRVATVVDRAIHWRSGALLPPAHLRIYYYGTWSPVVFERACAGVRTELLSRGLRPEHRVLDIGCGIGNLAIGLIGYLRGSYDGLDIHPEAIAWCQRAITPRYSNFRFHRVDIVSRAYNPAGRSTASDLTFPFDHEAFDVVFLGSVFTHMLPDDIRHYFHEISRVLARGGICVASYFLLNDQSRQGVEAGRSFMSFQVEQQSGLYRLHDAAVPESAVAVDEQFIRRIHEEAGLRIEHIRRGMWWNGTRHDQDVLTAVRA
jgi:SAM-dependent methyltransferase